MRYHSARCELQRAAVPAADIRHHWSRGSLEDALASSGCTGHGRCENPRAMPAGFESILTRDALDFLAALARRFTSRVHELLAVRERRQRALGCRRDPRTFSRRRAPSARATGASVQFRRILLDRRVEITGPTIAR